MRLSGWRGLGVFWAAVLLLAVACGIALQLMGTPPRPAGLRASADAPSAPAHPMPAPASGPVPAALPTTPPAAPLAAAPATAPGPSLLFSPGRDTPGPIASPDPSLMEPAKSGGGAMLPRMDPSGRAPMQAYAGGFDRSSRRARVGVIVAGLGMNEADSLDAIRKLPLGVTVAVSPYGQRLTWQLDAARIGSHEILLSLPLEPQGFPQNDPGDHALLTGADPAQNAARLDWALSRFAGYAGVTNALGTMRGERFSGASDLMAPLLDGLSRRGLFFVDARPGAAPWPGLWSATVDVVIDEPPDRAAVQDKLAQLERLARDRGAAVGLISAPRPAVIDAVAAWTNGLQDKGLILAPASALVQWRPKPVANAASAQSAAGAPK